MTEEQAQRFVKEIEAVCEKYGAWYILEKVMTPQLNILRIKEISVRITAK